MCPAEILPDLRLGSYQTALPPHPWPKLPRDLLLKAPGASNPQLWGKRHGRTALLITKSPAPIAAHFGSKPLWQERQGIAVVALHSAPPPKAKGCTPSAVGDGSVAQQCSKHSRLSCSRGKLGRLSADQGVLCVPQSSGREPAGSCTPH